MRSHSDSKGFELKRPNDSIYTFPCPDCMCRTNKSEDSRPSSATWFGMKMFGGCSHLWFCEHTLLLTPLFCVGILLFFPPPAYCGEGIHLSFGNYEEFVRGQNYTIIFLGIGLRGSCISCICAWSERSGNNDNNPSITAVLGCWLSIVSYLQLLYLTSCKMAITFLNTLVFKMFVN